RERGVPDRRLARLEPPFVALLDREATESVQRTGERGVIERIPLEVQREHRVHPRRLDPAPRSVRLLALEDPLAREPACELAQRPDRMALVPLQRAVEALEAPLPGREGMDHLAALSHAELAERERQRSYRPVGADDGERHDRLARPAREVVDVE